MDVFRPLNAQVLETNWQLLTESRLVMALGILLIGLQITLLILASWTFAHSQLTMSAVTATEVLAQIATILALLQMFVATQTWASYNVKGPFFWIVLFVLLSIVFLVSSAALRSRAGSTMTASPVSGSSIATTSQAFANRPQSGSGASWTPFVNLSFGVSIAMAVVLLVLVFGYTRPILLALENVPRTLGLS